MSERRLTRNAMRCDGCDTTIESTHVHHMQWCNCGALAVDGGLFYNRVLFDKKVPYTDMCEYADA